MTVECSLSDTGAAAVGQAISKNKYITTLVLSYVLYKLFLSKYRIVLEI